MKLVSNVFGFSEAFHLLALVANFLFIIFCDVPLELTVVLCFFFGLLPIWYVSLQENQEDSGQLT
jgi:hypothetical protein